MYTDDNHEKIITQNSQCRQEEKPPTPSLNQTKKEVKSKHYRGIIFLNKERKTSE